MQTKLPESPEETIDFLKSYGALEEGHFLLASGRHSGHYVKKGLLVQHPFQVQKMIEQRLEALGALGQIDVVLSPAVGGIPVGQQVGLALGVRTIYAERSRENALALKRGFQILPGERVLMVEDVITTGGTLVELKDFVKDEGGEIAGVFVLVNRSGLKNWQGWPLVSCMEVQFPTYEEGELPEELGSLPVVRPGTKKVG
ncbi:MAG: orotate phosphoribosyltransferase [Verrucomicrobiota bacterium]